MSVETKNVTLTNVSNQLLTLQLRPPGGDFYLQERNIQLLAGKSITVQHDHLNPAQLENIKARRQLRIVASN